MKTLTITDNSIEKLEIKNDGERFAINHIIKSMLPNGRDITIIFNPDEAKKIANFIYIGLFDKEK